MAESPRPRRRIEREFGVPIAGDVLDPARWTNTSLKTLPSGHIEWATVFDRSAPVVLDLGCGNGRYLLHSSVWRPECDHLGVDTLPLVIRYATRRANQRGLRNVRFAVCGGRELLADHVAPGSVAEIHVYHPQPYYEPGEVHLRLMTPAFLALAHRALFPGGAFFIQTDHPAYWDYIQQVLPAFFDLAVRRTPWPDAPKGRTRREIIALRRGLPVFRGECRARTDVSPEQIAAQVASLPLPTFNADRSLCELDALEREE